VYPEERVNAYKKDIVDMSKRFGLQAVKSAGGISANQILKTVQKPSGEPYWKVRYKGACEEVMFLTINDKVNELVSVMNGQAAKAGYPVSDMGVYIQPIVQGTGVHCEFNLFYDPKNPNEVNKVKNLSSVATKALLANGAFFSRPYGINTQMIMNRDAATVDVLNKLKKMFDPNGVMNPGKICW
jgi:FAD/FMN-containing dehydrogenase